MECITNASVRPKARSLAGVTAACLFILGCLLSAHAQSEKEEAKPSAVLRHERQPIDARIARLETKLSDLEAELAEEQEAKAELEADLAEAVEAEAAGTAEEPKPRGFFDRLFNISKTTTPEDIRGELQDTHESIADLESDIGYTKTQIATQEQRKEILDAKIKYVDARVEAEDASSLASYHSEKVDELTVARKDAFDRVRALTGELSRLRSEEASREIIDGKVDQVRAAEKEAVRLDRALDHHRYETLKATRRVERSQKALQEAYVQLQRHGIHISDAELAEIVEASTRKPNVLRDFFQRFTSDDKPKKRKPETQQQPSTTTSQSQPRQQNEQPAYTGPETEWH